MSTVSPWCSRVIATSATKERKQPRTAEGLLDSISSSIQGLSSLIFGVVGDLLFERADMTPVVDEILDIETERKGHESDEDDPDRSIGNGHEDEREQEQWQH